MTETININAKEISYVNQPLFFQQVAAGKWEPESFKVLDAFVQPGKFFIDIGSWVGVLSIYAARLGANVIAVEPDPVSFEELKDNVAANKLNIATYKMAIGYKNGHAILNSMTNGFGNSESSLLNRGVIDGTKKVLCSTLKNFVNLNRINPQDICLIKIDVEGSEIFILNEAREFLKEFKPKIYISFHPTYFSELDIAIKMFTEVIFPVYSVIDVNMRVHDEESFAEAMKSKDNHSFILIPK